MDSDKISSLALKVLEVEAKAIEALSSRVGESFVSAIEMILGASGKVVVTGMGKSGLICQKIASTLASTGTAAFFLHPAEGAHGDLGVLGADDILLAVSNSGETEEIVRMVPAVKRMGLKMIAMTGRADSTLAEYADCVLDISVDEEACPLGLAPTASTTATLAMGDALAVVLLSAKGFKAEDFATLHPAGNLGRKLLKVTSLMHSGEDLPMVNLDTSMKDAILVMTQKRLGITGVFDASGKLIGAITDGDLRRVLEKGVNVFESTAADVMSIEPKVIKEDALAEAALKEMDDSSITSLFVESVDSGSSGEVIGVIHLHDLIKAGVI
jgi:arabinose-5-phosphate isomerase